MPPYEDEPAEADPTTTFWLQERELDNFSGDDEELPLPYSYAKLSYQLKKKHGTFQSQYVSKTPLSPGKIHWVRLQYKKLDTPISFDPDA